MYVEKIVANFALIALKQQAIEAIEIKRLPIT